MRSRFRSTASLDRAESLMSIDDRRSSIVDDGRWTMEGRVNVRAVGNFALPLVGIALAGPCVVGGEHDCRGSPVTTQDMGGKQALHHGALGEARGNGSGHRTPRLLQPSARRARVSARHRHRHTARILARHVDDRTSDVRSGHPDTETHLAAGVASARSGAVSEVRACGTCSR